MAITTQEAFETGTDAFNAHDLDWFAELLAIDVAVRAPGGMGGIGKAACLEFYRHWFDGIHLNVIEAAMDPAGESWRNLNTMNDLVREIVETDSHLVISALGGDAAAGGVPLALAADHVVAREDVVLNPYYQHMGGLYGSEY